MADSKQYQFLRPKGPLLPMNPSKTPISSIFRAQDGSALNFIMAKDNEKPILFNPRDTPQPFLELAIMEKRKGQHGEWKPQNIGSSSN